MPSKTRKNKRHGSLKEIIPTFLGMLGTVKLHHWNTFSFSTHKATDELYSELNEKIDSFIETLLGTVGRSALVHPLSLKIPLTSDIKKQVAHYKSFLTAMPASYGTDVLNIRDEILATLDKFLYLLTFR
jgi:DNA-binding ferritin-like protein